MNFHVHNLPAYTRYFKGRIVTFRRSDVGTVIYTVELSIDGSRMDFDESKVMASLPAGVELFHNVHQ